MTIDVSRALCATAIRHAEQTPGAPNCSSTKGRRRKTKGFMSNSQPLWTVHPTFPRGKVGSAICPRGRIALKVHKKEAPTLKLRTARYSTRNGVRPIGNEAVFDSNLWKIQRRASGRNWLTGAGFANDASLSARLAHNCKKFMTHYSLWPR